MGAMNRLRGIKYYELRVKDLTDKDAKSKIVKKSRNVIDQSAVEMDLNCRYTCVARKTNGSTKTIWTQTTTPYVVKEKTKTQKIGPMISIDPVAKKQMKENLEGLAEVMEVMEEFKNVFTGGGGEPGEEYDEGAPPGAPPDGYPPQQQGQPGQQPMYMRTADGSFIPVAPPKFGEGDFPWYTHPYGLDFVDRIMDRSEKWVTNIGEKFGEAFKKKLFGKDDDESDGKSSSQELLGGLLED